MPPPSVDLYGAPAVVVDFGTAVTFDILSPEGDYVGGVIAPGLEVMTDYLFQRTALLPRISPVEPRPPSANPPAPPCSPAPFTAIAAWCARSSPRFGASSARRRRLHVIATGGYATLISARLPEIKLVHPNLTLEGLRIIGNLNFK